MAASATPKPRSGVRRRRRLGQLAALDAGRETLAEFAEEWWRVYASPNLAVSTLRTCATLWDLHVLPRLGSGVLRELDVRQCQAFAAELAAANVGPAASRKTLALLGAVLQKAVEWSRIPADPVRAVKLPAAKRSRIIRPLTPAEVERLRSHLDGPHRLRDPTLVSVLAYAGPRPSDALGLRWRDVGARTLTLHAPKTNRVRSVRLMAPVAADLAAWRAGSGPADGSAFVFPRTDGERWTEVDWRNWRARVFFPALEAAGLERRPPSDLRHSAASLWLDEGCSGSKSRPGSGTRRR